MRDERRRAERTDPHMAANKVVDRLPATPVRNHLQLDACDLRKPFGRNVLRDPHVRRLFDTIGGASTLILRRSLLLTSPSFVLPAVLDKITPVASARER